MSRLFSDVFVIHTTKKGRSRGAKKKKRAASLLMLAPVMAHVELMLDRFLDRRFRNTTNETLPNVIHVTLSLTRRVRCSKGTEGHRRRFGVMVCRNMMLFGVDTGGVCQCSCGGDLGTRKQCSSGERTEDCTSQGDWDSDSARVAVHEAAPVLVPLLALQIHLGSVVPNVPLSLFFHRRSSPRSARAPL